MSERIMVSLKVDLTRYGEGLLRGSKGYTIGNYGEWSRGSDRFVGVCFPGVKTLDVLWESLEIIDEEYLKEKEMVEDRKKEELKNATDVIKYVGPRGGFRYLCYSYKTADGILCNTSSDSKKSSEILINYFVENGIEVKKEILK